MADEDEIDVLGDFNLDILSKSEGNIFDTGSLVSQNSDLLNCDYTIHPQWLLDRPSTNPALWYNTSSPELDIKPFEFETNLPHVSTENSISDESGWTEKEKNLLNRGIEIFGKSNVNLSQFIGSRTPAEVKYFLKNFYSDLQLSCSSDNVILDEGCGESIFSSDFTNEDGKELLEDNEIPASIEEVIAVVSTAETTTSNNHKLPNLNLSYDKIPSGQSLLKSSYSKADNRMIDIKKSPRKQKKSAKFKFKTRIKVNKNKQISTPKKKIFNKNRRRTKTEIETIKSESSDIQIITGNGTALTISEGEEVIKIKKEEDLNNSESDVEIDVEDTDDDPIPVSSFIKKEEAICKEEKDTENTKDLLRLDKKCTENNFQKREQKITDLEFEELTSLELPHCEIFLNANEITEVEKFVFYEFFAGRPTKTPARYLRIRNHIINTWKSVKPNYVTKTSIRNGLKQCGDVNCISRIHSYLEQIGAINFGCSQITYVRPLYDFIMVTPPAKEKTNTFIEHAVLPQSTESAPRQRNKKKYVNDGEGGYTLTHDEKGDIIDITVINEEPVIKQRNYIKKPIVRLINCRTYNHDKKQNFSVKLDLSALILMDLHAHMYLTEVMGLIGGNWNSLKKVLYIKKYEPCKNIASSSTHCDMCPISQAKAAEILHEENLEILGWYHSHPTFAPEPSQQDIETQLSVQQWIGYNKPCIGFILSPFSCHGALIASPYRCLIVDKKENFEDQFVPYQFKVDIIAEQLDINDLLFNARRILNSDCNVLEKSSVDFKKMYFQDNSITYLDKFIYSVKMHLAKCSRLNKMSCDEIIDGLSNICIKMQEKM